MIEDLTAKLCHNEHRIENCCSDLDFSKETIFALRSHIDSLKVTLTDKFDCITKLKGDNQIVKVIYIILILNFTIFPTSSYHFYCRMKIKF